MTSARFDDEMISLRFNDGMTEGQSWREAPSSMASAEVMRRQARYHPAYSHGTSRIRSPSSLIDASRPRPIRPVE